MTLPARLRATLVPVLLTLLALTACAAPSPEAQQPEAGTPTSASSPAPAASAPEPKAPADRTPDAGGQTRQTGGPLPPERVGDRVEGQLDAPAAEVKIDMSCRTDAECTVKNVGNCCGHYPACVNVNSPTDPKGVQERCAKQGMGSVCGFPEISACACVQGKCEASDGGAVR